MIERHFLAACAAFALAGCSIWAEPAVEPAPAPPPVAAEAPAPPVVAAPGVAAPGVTAPPAPAPEAPEDPNSVVVRGQVERQAPPPEGDPRPASVRMQHIRAWDQCVSRAQGAAESDSNRVQLDTPEDICRSRLGMSNRDAIPDSWRP